MTSDRRPIATREKKTSRALASWLVARGISPNAISFAGLLFGLAAGVCFWLTSREFGPERLWWLLGGACVQTRLGCNMLDGMVAVRSGRSSSVGELWNEVPDRVADAGTLIGVGYAFGGNIGLGFAATAVAVFVAYVRAMGKAAGASNDFRGPMAKPHRMFAVTMLALLNTLLPDDAKRIWSALATTRPIGFAEICLWIIIIGGGFTAWRRLHRIASQLRQRAAEGAI